MSETDNETLPVQDELASLKARADQMGINYHPSIGVEKLRDKINAVLSDEESEEEEDEQDTKQAAPEKAVEESPQQRRRRKREEASKLVRIRVTCMNPAKAEWEGEIFTAGNTVVGTFSKFVPFNADEGWHVPHIIYQQIVNRQCQVFTTVRDGRGNATRKGKLIKEFAVEVMPQLKQEELAELARRQAASKSID